MTAFELMQQTIIGIVVAISALYVLRKLLPKWTRSRQAALAAALNQPSRPFILRSVGRFMTPVMTSGGGCGSGCNSCSSCASNPEADTEVKPLEFQRHI